MNFLEFLKDDYENDIAFYEDKIDRINDSLKDIKIELQKVKEKYQKDLNNLNEFDYVDVDGVKFYLYDKYLIPEEKV